MKGLAHEKTDGARQAKRAYKALSLIEAADKTVPGLTQLAQGGQVRAPIRQRRQQ